ncbi:SIR2 family protein [Rothia nasimurium]|uniref:SIR2 family protein n=1 Tax=Rothia nasimurium TaxID=85336 RepID=UPI002DD6A345|nr:SIR2 family protein [Rothia nasimurium]
MATSKRRTAVLFGAGASVDAGLPQTQGLARNVLEIANQPHPFSRGVPEDWVQSLNFIYGSMVDFESREGGNPLKAVDFERLVSAIRLLQDPDNHESAPFVMNWKPGSAGFSSSTRHSTSSHSFERAFHGAVTGSINNYRNRTRDLYQEIRNLIGFKLDSRKSFEEAENKVFEIVKQILSELNETQYLNPLAELAEIQEEGLDVLTLNYDLAVESMAEQLEVNVNYGFDQWRPGTQLNWNHTPGNINLIKMHGSLNWHETNQRSFLPHVTAEADLVPVSSKPWIVLGDKEKLSTKGPTLDLLRAGEEALERADHLVVAGYSFADEHINNLIFAWLEGKESRSIAVIDPGFPKYENAWGKEQSARNYLMEVYSLRLKVFHQGAAQALESALNLSSTTVLQQWFSVEEEKIDGNQRRIKLTLLGPPLGYVNFYATYSFGVGFRDPIEIYVLTGEVGQVIQSQGSSFRGWDTGVVKTFIINAQKDVDIIFNINADARENNAPVHFDYRFGSDNLEI